MKKSLTSLHQSRALILGLPWLRHCNPEINWHKGTMKLSTTQETEVLELEITKVAANRMERCQLLAEMMKNMVLTSGEVTGLSQDRVSKQDTVAGKHRKQVVMTSWYHSE